MTATAPARRCLTSIAVWLLAVVGAVPLIVLDIPVPRASATTSTPSKLPQTRSTTVTPGAAGRLDATWQQILKHSVDLGSSRAPSASLLAQLRSGVLPQALRSWTTEHGLQFKWSLGDRWAVVSGRPSSLGTALNIKIDDYHSAGVPLFYAARHPPAVPEELRVDVASFGSISSYLRLKELDVPRGGLTPTGLLQAYDAQPLRSLGLNGEGATIVLFEVDGFSQGDLNQFNSAYHLPPIHVTVDGGLAGAPKGEATLDIETAHEIAPAAHLVYFNFATNSASVMASDFKRVATRYPGAIWSMSLGFCELQSGFSVPDFTSLEAALESASKTGTTIFASSGDSGGFDCTPPSNSGDNPQNSFIGVVQPASFPAVTSVGGSTLTVTTSGAYAGETAWTEPLLSQGTGGGISQVWQVPSWQNGPGTGNFVSQNPGRQVPDVAADADAATGVAGVIGGSSSQSGGTSLAAPIWAGFMVLIDQYLRGQHQSAVGFANSVLYQIAQQSEPYRPFHDIVAGGNAVYSATPGYDMTTGLGTPDAWNLARDLAESPRK
jgi:kumamolisin